MNTTFRTVIASALCCSLALILGCSAGSKAKVSGVVTSKNAPIKGGNLTMSSESGGSYSAIIQPDGTYSISDVAAGNYTVTIETETLNPNKPAPKSTAGDKGGEREKMQDEYMKAMGKGGGENKSGAGDSGTGASKEDLAKIYTKIPTKYASKVTSGIQVDVGSGATVKDIPLAD